MMPGSDYLRFLLRILAGVAAVLFACGICSVTLRLRAHELAKVATPGSLKRAIALGGGNSDYWLRRADLLDQSGLSATECLQRAAELNPHDASVWIRLGLDAEGRHDTVLAERHLLHAARISRLYEPRWTLANFYFRQRRPDDFWKWAHEALDLAPSDASALFRLCWTLSSEGNEILNKAVPDIAEVNRQYVQFLLENQLLLAANIAAQRLVRNPHPENGAVLLEACDRFVEHGMTGAALACWNAACGDHQQHCEALNPGGVMTLMTAEVESRAPGFGWRVNQAEGVTVEAGHRIAAVYFDGNEPESVEVLSRLIPVIPVKEYVLRFETKTSGIPPKTGLRWQISGVTKSALQPISVFSDLSGSSWKLQSQSFSAPPGIDLVRLSLLYSRAPGSTRVEGSVYTRGLEMAAAR